MSIAPHFQHHIFVCLNDRGPSQECCHNAGAAALFEHLRVRVKSLGLAGAGRVRVNRAGCLDRCAHGPALVIYPEGTWYQPFDTADIDRIIDEHLLGGRVVEDLRIPPDDGETPAAPTPASGAA